MKQIVKIIGLWKVFLNMNWNTVNLKNKGPMVMQNQEKRLDLILLNDFYFFHSYF